MLYIQILQNFDAEADTKLMCHELRAMQNCEVLLGVQVFTVIHLTLPSLFQFSKTNSLWKKFLESSQVKIIYA